MTRTQRLAVTFLSVGIIASSTLAFAADAQYPTRPVRLIVPFAPGGGTDLAGRVLAAAVNEVWGTVSMVVDNRGGAGGSIGVELAAKANPDGYTVLLATIGTHAINPALYKKKMTYDHLRDFTPVAYIGSTPNVFMVHPGMPAKSLGEYIALAKASPG
ncbi:MAG TPA: tripartite tricarboxylate transporter substrate-binding protein, partial [Burkholderiales bacterium]|nr:tripartite tricarboxylate transporter substrate-binding protein [Burkholderiales bacterium]